MKYEVKIKKLPKSETEIEVSLPAELLESARKKAIEHFGLILEIDGFRKGHIPEKIVVEKIGEGGLLEEAADILLKEHFPKAIIQENLDILGQPKISITKLGLGNPLEFKAVFATMPKFELPDYKAIAKSSKASVKSSEKDLEVTQKEIDDVLLQIRKNKAHLDWHKAHKEEYGHNHPEIKDEDLPPLDDELAKAAGNFKNLDELRGKIKENIIEEKKYREIEKRRAAIIEELVKKTKIEVPEILVDSETEKSLAQMKDDIERMGMKFKDYVAHTKKTEEDFKKELREPSEKRAKIQLIFNKIALAENLKPNEEVLGNEVKQIMEHYKDANEQSVRIYVATTLLNQEVLKLLENQN